MGTVSAVPSMDIEEADTIPFVFDPELPVSVTILSAAVTIDIRQGNEASPSNFAVGAPQISSGTRQVLQKLDARNVAPGRYAVRCVASRSDGLRSVGVALVTVERL